MQVSDTLQTLYLGMHHSSSQDLLPHSLAAWHRKIWRLAAPVILANLSVPLVGAVDTAVMGQLPDPRYMAAVAVGAVIFSFIFWGCGFLRMTTTGLVAQAYGGHDGSEVRAVLMRSITLGLLLGTALILLQQLIAQLAFRPFAEQPQIVALAQDYYSARIWGAPATLLNYVVLGSLIGLHSTGLALLTQLVLNLTNIVLDLLFVLSLGWGIEGVAWASVVAESTAAGCGLALLWRRVRTLSGEWPTADWLRRDKVTALLQMNLDIMLRTICLIAAFYAFTAVGSRYGAVTLAANALLLHFQSFLAFGLDGFAHATESLAGSAYGARRKSAFQQALKVASIWAAAVAVAYSLVFWLGGKWMLSLFTDTQAVLNSAAEYLPWLIVSPLISVWSYQLDGAFIGATRAAEMRNAMLLSISIYCVALLVLVPLLANHGLWASLMIFMVARALTLYWCLPRIMQQLS